LISRQRRKHGNAYFLGDVIGGLARSGNAAETSAAIAQNHWPDLSQQRINCGGLPANGLLGQDAHIAVPRYICLRIHQAP
jgi:hypothetical protein